MIYNQGNIKEIHYNGFTISKVYACGGFVYDDTPSFQTKLKYRTSADTYYIACDSSSTITQLEFHQDLYNHSIPSMWNYAIRSVEIGDCVEHIGDLVFDDMFSISSVTLPNTVKTIGSQSFKNTSISSITIPSGVTSIGSNAFRGCDELEELVIPSGITEIELQTFDDCKKLRNIILPYTITSIGDYAFHISSHDAESIQTERTRVVRLYATTPPTIGTNAFGASDGGAIYKIYVPNESLDAYKAAWGEYAERLEGM